MAGREAELTAPFAVDEVHDVGYFRIMGGTGTLEHGAQHGAAQLVGDRDEQGEGDYREDYHPPIEVADENVKDGDIKRNPHQLVGEQVHERVPIRRVPSVDGKEQGLVDMLQCF